jgi:(p)ppGpp synthase/HD superfamily hydrolase
MRNELNLVHKALEFAAKAHRTLMRKGTDIPYIVHPMEAALILTQAGASDSLIAAALLHDTLEDTKTTEQELEDVFGETVVDFVRYMTKNDDLDWFENRLHSIEKLGTSSREEMMLFLADKLANLRSIAADYAEIGDKLWDRFNKGHEDQKWYYVNIAKRLSPLSDMAAYQEYVLLVDRVFHPGPKT